MSKAPSDMKTLDKLIQVQAENGASISVQEHELIAAWLQWAYEYLTKQKQSHKKYHIKRAMFVKFAQEQLDASEKSAVDRAAAERITERELDAEESTPPHYVTCEDCGRRFDCEDEDCSATSNHTGQCEDCALDEEERNMPEEEEEPDEPEFSDEPDEVTEDATTGQVHSDGTRTRAAGVRASDTRASE